MKIDRSDASRALARTWRLLAHAEDLICDGVAVGGAVHGLEISAVQQRCFTLLTPGLALDEDADLPASLPETMRQARAAAATWQDAADHPASAGLVADLERLAVVVGASS